MNLGANIKEALIEGGNNHLPGKLYKIAGVLTTLTLVISACSTLAPIPSSDLPNSNDSTELRVEPTITSTATTVPTETAQPLSAVDGLLENYFDGAAIDVSSLSPEEFSEFSVKLAEARNTERGVNPIIYNNEAFISPDNFMMMNYDGHPDLSETIEMYLAIKGRDGEGNLQIIDRNGKIITIEGSADVEWGATGMITDFNDPRLDWPNLEPSPKSRLDTVQYPLSNEVEYPETLIPVILLDKGIGQIFLAGEQQMMQNDFHFFTIETDSAKNAILARLVIMFPGPVFRLFKEGESFRSESYGGFIPDYSDFYKDISENSVYYASIEPIQDMVISDWMFTAITGYQGIVARDEAFSVIAGQTENNKDIIVLAAGNLIKTSK